MINYSSSEFALINSSDNMNIMMTMSAYFNYKIIFLPDLMDISLAPPCIFQFPSYTIH